LAFWKCATGDYLPRQARPGLSKNLGGHSDVICTFRHLIAPPGAPQTGVIVISTVIDSLPPPWRTPLIGGQAL
jgi:hypothetical protein